MHQVPIVELVNPDQKQDKDQEQNEDQSKTPSTETNTSAYTYSSTHDNSSFSYKINQRLIHNIPYHPEWLLYGNRNKILRLLNA
jgi:hypothetical protein